MYYYEPMIVRDLYKINLINLDSYTECFDMNYYLKYLQSVDCNQMVVKSKLSANKNLGFCLGHIKTQACSGFMNTIGLFDTFSKSPHYHISCITIEPSFRRLKLAQELMKLMEQNGKILINTYIDLYVRSTNAKALVFYRKLNYKINNKVKNYYSDPSDDAFVMRKDF
ncbi:NAT3 [Hepatospora eriocheir]|uniref:NAT3 n=1 Tax=Hepatospora eriocheir TaxID=1081669 RepID=A0A1X0QK13_9MICR|nr:NAT3 [Hepatospora eriocheir]